MTTKLQTVDDYIQAAPATSQKMAQQLRAAIKKAAPDAEEKLSYGMPYYGYHGRLVYWGAFSDHVALYVMSAAREALNDKLKPYQRSKATYYFPLSEKLPTDLITEVVQIQAAANKEKG